MLWIALTGCGDETREGKEAEDEVVPIPEVLQSPGDCGVRPGYVRFDAADVVQSNASAEDERAIRWTIAEAWRAYLRVDDEALADWLTDDAIRMSGRWGAGTIQHGAAAIAAGLHDEAQAYERGSGVIDEEHLVSRAEIFVQGSTATVLYWDTGLDGYRWCGGGNQGLVLQVLVKEDGVWRIAHWTDSFSSSFDLANGVEGEETFRFDFSHPVLDLQRAIDFYTPLLGSPELVEAERAIFRLPRGSRFVLDATGLEDVAVVEPGLTNGWATVDVADVRAERDRLQDAGVATIDDGAVFGDEDPFVIVLDEPDNNPVVLRELRPATSGPGPGAAKGLDGLGTVRDIVDAWLATDADALDALYADGTWYDDTRVKTRGPERGDLGSALQNAYWPRYDRGPDGLSVELEAQDVQVRTFGGRQVVSYLQVLTGTGAHGFRETALVTHVLDEDGPVISFTTRSDATDEGQILGPDYIGYPTTAVVAETAGFYTDTMGFGVPYVDAAWRGWWSDNGAVFGAYGARPARDDVPRPGVPSAYISFWVRSAEDTLAYLEQTGADFPTIPAIGGRSPLQHYPGYTQVLATDSEGNPVLFTEYTGD